MTRLLVGSDFHLSPLVESFESRLAEDVVPIFCGDLVNRPRDDAPAFFDIVGRWRTKNAELIVVPGNHDPEDTGPWEGIQVHERRGLRILALPVTPLMAKIPTWTHEYSERRIAEMLAPWEGGAYDVIASHAPPRGVCDRVFWGLPIGSEALASFAERVSFRVWLCGHVHEQRGRRGEIAGRPLHNAARAVIEVSLEDGGTGSRRVLRGRRGASRPT